MITDEITHLHEAAPLGGNAGRGQCGVNDAGQGTTTGGTPGQCWVTVASQDVVVWYAAHFTHDVNVHTGHIVGPTLKFVK